MVYATSNEIKYGISIQRVLHETSNCASALVCIRAKIITIWIYKEVKDKSTLNLLMPQQVTQCCKTHLNSLPIEWTHSGYLNQQNTSYPPPLTHLSYTHAYLSSACLSHVSISSVDLQSQCTTASRDEHSFLLRQTYITAQTLFEIQFY